MLTIPGVPQIAMWIGFIALVFVFLLIDLGFFNKRTHIISVKEAVIWTVLWFSLAMIFNLFIWYTFGKEYGLQFFTGYLIEKSLSVDNLFVILLIFTSFKINPKYQHKVLFWGILGALVMRGLMIGVGSALISRFHWILYVFGIFLLYSGIGLFFKKEGSYDPHESFVVKLIKKFVYVSKAPSNGKMFVKEGGKKGVTILFVALMVIEFTDVAFAFDSIPAIFGITLEPYIIFTSNIFAILGLRSLYFVIMHAHKYFRYLPMGLAVILIFIGLKMLLEGLIEISIITSLSVVGVVLVIFMLASLFLVPKRVKT